MDQQNKLIASNTIVTYSRTILNVFLSLYSTRWVLQELGENDFGLYSLVGSLLIVLVFLSEKIINGVSRFYAYEIGRSDYIAVQKYFNSAISINIIFSFFFIFLSLTIGEYFITNILEIPPTRIYDSILVLRISVFSTVLSLIAAPYVAMFTAKQNLIDLSLTLILQSVLSFIGIYCMRFFVCDKLLLYTILMCIVYIITYSIQIYRARHLYSECHIKREYLFEKRRIIELTKFSFWNLLADLGHLVRTQGINILTNLFFSTNGNAALGIANRVASQSSSLTNSLSNALSPAIISYEGRSETKKALEISLLSPKIGIILMLYFSVPLITEIDYILKLWLNNVPKGTSVLCISIITMFIIEKTTLGLSNKKALQIIEDAKKEAEKQKQEILLQANGKIAKAQTTIAISYSLSILLAFIMIKVNIGLLSIGAACILSMILSRIGIIFCAKEVTHIELTDWFLGLAIPIIILSLLLFSFSFLITNLFNASIGRLIANILLNAILTTFLSFLILFNHQIRKRIINFIIKNKEKG